MPVDVPNVLLGDDVVPWMASDGTTPVNNRRQIRRGLLAPLLAPGTAELVVRDGVLPRQWGGIAGGTGYSSLSLLQGSTPGQFVVPFLGNAIISRSGQGPSVYTQRTSPNIPLDPADAINPRYDLVYLRLYDAALGDSIALHGVRWGVMKGDPAAAPVIPPLPAVDGVIPVGAVLRPANVNSVANSQITDMRKSAGLLGAVRPLLGGDLVTDPGLVHGERRSRATPAALTALGAPPILTDWWDAINNTWRGTQSFAFDVATLAANTNIAASGGVLNVASITIPDPGWPYKITAGGSARVTGFPAGSSALAILAHRVGAATWLNVPSNDLCSWLPYQSATSGGNAYWGTPNGTAKGPGGAAGGYTGSQTVRQMIQNNHSGVVVYQGADPSNRFTVRIDPA